MRTISATEAKNRFGSVLNEVSRTGGPILIERSGHPLAVIISVDSYEAVMHTPLPGDQELIQKIYAAFGMWSDREEIIEDWLREGRQHWHSEWPDDAN